MPTIKYHHRHRTKLTGIIVGACLAIALIIVSVIISKHQNNHRQTNLEEVLNKAQDMALSNNPTGAIAQLQNQLPALTKTTDKQMVYLTIGVDYENIGKYPQALAAYQQAHHLGATFGTNFSLARITETLGDTAMAIKYYQACQAIIQADHTNAYQSDAPEVIKALTRLGAS